MQRFLITLAFVFGLQVEAAELRPCFTPGQDCLAVIVSEIDGAKTELLVQAYGFTSPAIIQAIVKAKERGVNVDVLLDKINERRQYTGATYLVNHGIEPRIDFKVAIAHNKVIVIDGQTVVTGSFNFTTAAQQRNAENVIVIQNDVAIANAYSENFYRRAIVSRPYNDFRGRRSAPEADANEPKQ